MIVHNVPSCAVYVAVAVFLWEALTASSKQLFFGGGPGQSPEAVITLGGGRLGAVPAAQPPS